jgi:hypothetical protein
VTRCTGGAAAVRCDKEGDALGLGRELATTLSRQLDCRRTTLEASVGRKVDGAFADARSRFPVAVRGEVQRRDREVAGAPRFQRSRTARRRCSRRFPSEAGTPLLPRRCVAECCLPDATLYSSKRASTRRISQLRPVPLEPGSDLTDQA